MIARNGDFGLRYRVGRVDTVNPTDAYMFIGAVREFKTFDGARAYCDHLVRDLGVRAVIQTGVIEWMSDEDAIERTLAMQAEGRTWL